VQQIAVLRQPKVKHLTTVARTQPTPDVIQTPAIVGNQQPVLAAVSEKPAIISKPVVPDNNVPLGVKTSDITDQTVQPTVMASVSPKASTIKRSRIRGLGGLINAAVAIIDRRDDKVIEFTNTDEGDTVTGINLGIIKIKKNQ